MLISKYNVHKICNISKYFVIKLHKYSVKVVAKTRRSKVVVENNSSIYVSKNCYKLNND